jgi:hypothetical protein
MPEHVHLLMSEPERAELSVALQMLKQNVARRLRTPEGGLLWLPRYYDFNVWSDAKRVEKLQYMHRNPVRRGLVRNPEDWAWRVFVTMFRAWREWSRLSRRGRRGKENGWESRWESGVKSHALCLQRTQTQGRGTLRTGEMRAV